MIRSVLAGATLLVVISIVSLASVASAQQEAKTAGLRPARADGLAAWQQVHSVLTHPRCINCHTAGDYPQQGDDRHRHLFNVVRGPEGKGVPALQCGTCHQDANADSTGVPGAHGWHLAPLSMQWQDSHDKILPSSAICKAITDRSKNGGRDGAALLEHHEGEALILWTWNPGRRPDGSVRAQPPISHDQFVAATRKWVDAGMPCPQ